MLTGVLGIKLTGVRLASGKEADITPIISALAAFYAVVGVVIVPRAYKPTCRICLFRQFCPNRQGEHLNSAGKPCRHDDQTTE